MLDSGERQREAILRTLAIRPEQRFWCKRYFF
jgi:hypothetical protein